MQRGGQPFGEGFSKPGAQPKAPPEPFCSWRRAGCSSGPAAVIGAMQCIHLTVCLQKELNRSSQPACRGSQSLPLALRLAL